MTRARRLAAALRTLAAHLRDEELARIATFAASHGCGLSEDFAARGAAILAEVDALLAARSPGAEQPQEEAGVWRCSFCGKTQDEVRKLIASPTVRICNECIDLCNDIIAEEADDTNDADDVTGDRELRCSFCGKHEAEVGKLFSGPTVYICKECIDRCNQTIGEEG